MIAKDKPNELRLTRVYDAPVKAVWDAWTEPDQVAKWWGPRGFTITTHSKDLRPGGHWAYTMHGPDGTDWENKTIYHEVEKHARLVYDHGGNDDRPPLFRVTVVFTEVKGKTKMQMTMALASAEAAAETAKFIKKAGGNSTWDRLAEFLEKESTGQEKFVINRSFETSVDTMFKMWTQPEHLSRWLPPTGFTMRIHSGEIKAGSGVFYSMSNSTGDMTMYGRCDYREIEAPRRLVYDQQFCDEDGKISRPSWTPHWPLVMRATVTLSEEPEGRTRVTVEWEPQAPVTKEEMAAFVAERAGMTQGWTGSFDKLEEALSAR